MALLGKYPLTVFFLTLFLGAIVLGPLLYFGLAFIWPIPFHRAMDRALLVSSLAALALLWPRIPVASLWPWHRHAGMQLLLGYVIAAVSIQAMIGFDVAFCGVNSSHLSGAKAIGRVVLSLVAALWAPPLEETVFRGFIQRELVEAMGFRVGWLLAAAIYMLAHFLKVPVELDRESVHFWSGATALGAAFLPIVHGDFLSGRGLNLFLIGLILGGLFLRSGNLWANAGLHSGWILGLLLFTGFARPADTPHVAFFGGDILSSLSTTLVLLLTGLWLWRFYRHPSDSPANGANAP